MYQYFFTPLLQWFIYSVMRNKHTSSLFWTFIFNIPYLSVFSFSFFHSLPFSLSGSFSISRRDYSQRSGWTCRLHQTGNGQAGSGRADSGRECPRYRTCVVLCGRDSVPSFGLCLRTQGVCAQMCYH